MKQTLSNNIALIESLVRIKPNIALNEIVMVFDVLGVSYDDAIEAFETSLKTPVNPNYKKDIKEELEELKEVWNTECCPPMAKIKSFNQARINMFKKIRKDYSLDDLILVARHMASQDFYQSKKDTPTAIDTLLRTTAFQAKYEIAISQKEKAEHTDAQRKVLLSVLKDYN